MNYYEELGLSRTASLEEIRQGYRQFVRLIHPDQQPDDRLRTLAEIQMKRLNRIIEVLSDPARRRDYDRSLAPATALASIQLPTLSSRRSILSACARHVDRTVWVWVAAWLVGIAAIGAFFGDFVGAKPVPAEAVYAKPEPPRFQPAAPVDDMETPAQPFHRLLPEPSRLIPSLREASQTELPPQPELAMEPPAGMLPLPLPRLEPPQGFAGTWLYAPSARTSKTERVYAPEFIEMKITGQDDQIRGLYRARYLVTDKAISGAVVFHFEGRAAAPLSTLHWMGSGGAYGSMTLKLVSENSLTVNWIAQHLSEDLGLISGTATLVRRKDAP